MSFAIVSLLVIVVVAIIGIPILARVFSEAANRNENSPGDQDERTDENSETRNTRR